MHFPPFNFDTSRFERKYVVHDMEYHAVIQQVKNNNAAFSDLYYPRYINNIYFDTCDMDFFFDNVSGKGSRKKARIRWYGDLMGRIEKPVLEFKLREGMVGNKISFELDGFVLDETISKGILDRVFESSKLPSWVLGVMKMLSPALLNRYHRQYFISFDGDFRITVDNELEYYLIGSNNNSFMEKHTCDDTIVELKYHNKLDGKQAAEISNELPFRLTKSSKYVNGFELTHPGIAL